MSHNINRDNFYLKTFFQEINYDLFLDSMEEAERNSTRLRFNSSQDENKIHTFLLSNNINTKALDNVISELGMGCKITIISEGNERGLYLYSFNTSDPYQNYSFRYKL